MIVENLAKIIRKAEELEQMRLGLLKKPEPEDDYEYIPFRRRTGSRQTLYVEYRDATLDQNI